MRDSSHMMKLYCKNNWMLE